MPSIKKKRVVVGYIIPGFARVQSSQLAQRQHACLNIHEKFLYSDMLGRKDSNLRMTGPKPVALPLGDAPIL